MTGATGEGGLSREEIEKMEVTLVLSNKNEVPESELTDIANLMTRSQLLSKPFEP